MKTLRRSWANAGSETVNDPKCGISQIQAVPIRGAAYRLYPILISGGVAEGV